MTPCVSACGVRYEFNGIKHVRQGYGTEAVVWDEFAIFEILKELEKQGHWVAVRDLCEQQIQETPEWLTPYLCAGVAHANLGEFSEAVRRLEYVERMAASNLQYSAASRVLKQIRREGVHTNPQEIRALGVAGKGEGCLWSHKRATPQTRGRKNLLEER